MKMKECCHLLGSIFFLFYFILWGTDSLNNLHSATELENVGAVFKPCSVPVKAKLRALEVIEWFILADSATSQKIPFEAGMRSANETQGLLDVGNLTWSFCIKLGPLMAILPK